MAHQNILNPNEGLNESVTMEIQSVQAIFPEEVAQGSCPCQIIVQCSPNIELKIYLPLTYPSVIPSFEFCAPSVDGEKKRALLKKLDKICFKNLGEPMLYLLIESCLAFFSKERDQHTKNKKIKTAKECCKDVEERNDLNDDAALPSNFFSGHTIEDRKSVFQAHVAKLDTKDQVPELLSQLKEFGKIARAHHNLYAWRLVLRNESGRETEQHDCDDDGEDGSASRLLRLLDQMDARGVLVVVSRWKGGGKIGPDRFRHICNAARDALISGGFVKQQTMA